MAKTKKKVVRKKSYVAFVIDRSGSMSGKEKQTIDGVNSQFVVLRDNIEKMGDTEVSMIQFDDKIQIDFDGVFPEDLKEWSDSSFAPRGMTALHDSIWTAINLLKNKEVVDDTSYLVITISDGGENASKEITQQNLKSEIEKLQNTGTWTFTYMMAGIDIATVVNSLGASYNNIAQYTTAGTGTVTAYNVMSNSVAGYANLRSKGLSATNDFYSPTNTNLNDFDIDQIDKNVK